MTHGRFPTDSSAASTPSPPRIASTGAAADPLASLFVAAAGGTPAAIGALWAAVWPELLRLCRAALRSWGRRAGLEVGDLAGEVCARLLARPAAAMRDRRWFFRCCWRECERILVDRWRRDRIVRWVELPDAVAATPAAADAAPAAEELAVLARAHPRAAAVVAHVLQGGLSLRECAARLGTSVRTTQLDFARAVRRLRERLAPHPVANPAAEPQPPVGFSARPCRAG